MKIISIHLVNVKVDMTESKEFAEFVAKEAITLQGANNVFVPSVLFTKMVNVFQIVLIDNFLIRKKDSVSPTAPNLLKSGKTKNVSVQNNSFVTRSLVFAIPHVVLFKLGKEEFVRAFQDTIKEYLNHPASQYLAHLGTNGTRREGNAGQYVLEKAN